MTSSDTWHPGILSFLEWWLSHLSPLFYFGHLLIINWTELKRLGIWRGYHYDSFFCLTSLFVELENKRIDSTNVSCRVWRLLFSTERSKRRNRAESIWLEQTKELTAVFFFSCAPFRGLLQQRQTNLARVITDRSQLLYDPSILFIWFLYSIRKLTM